MTPTDESLALLLDPAREVPGWWWKSSITTYCTACKSDKGIEKIDLGYGDSWRVCEACGVDVYDDEDTFDLEEVFDPPRYTGPPFSTSPVACFQWVTPLLLELGCVIEQDGVDDCLVFFRDENDTTRVSVQGEDYAEVTTRALEWAHNNMPERLAEAVRRVREKGKA